MRTMFWAQIWAGRKKIYESAMNLKTSVERIFSVDCYDAQMRGMKCFKKVTQETILVVDGICCGCRSYVEIFENSGGRTAQKSTQNNAFEGKMRFS